jgi:hypothetical protein
MSALLPRQPAHPPALSAPTARSTQPDALALAWPDVAIGDVELSSLGDRGERFRVRARIRLGALLPADVAVDLLPVRGRPPGARCRLFSVQPLENGAFLFEGTPSVEELGRYGFEIRVGPATRLGTAMPLPAVVRRVAPPPRG